MCAAVNKTGQLGSFGSAAEGQEEFPILCATCLGENPYIRMVRLR
jgi:hypothetical protein